MEELSSGTKVEIISWEVTGANGSFRIEIVSSTKEVSTTISGANTENLQLQLHEQQQTEQLDVKHCN